MYLDAEVPLDGQSELDLLPDDERTQYEQSARANGDGWRIPPPFPDPLPEGTDPIVAWAVSRMTPQPLATFSQRCTSICRRPSRWLVRTFCASRETGGQELPAYVKRVQTDPAWQLFALNASHVAHVTAPEKLAAVHVEIARSDPDPHSPATVAVGVRHQHDRWPIVSLGNDRRSLSRKC